MANEQDVFVTLKDGCEQDMAKALAVMPEYESDAAAMFILPNELASRTLMGLMLF